MSLFFAGSPALGPNAENQASRDGVHWTPTRPLRCSCLRCRIRTVRHAWWVLTGRADALVWGNTVDVNLPAISQGRQAWNHIELSDRPLPRDQAPKPPCLLAAKATDGWIYVHCIGFSDEGWPIDAFGNEHDLAFTYWRSEPAPPKE